MKVHVSFTVNLDVEAWDLEYGGDDLPEIKHDVRQYLAKVATDHLHELGMDMPLRPTRRWRWRS
ncbi:hypothetical protein [Aeromicrobium sp.]|uniref:hypothetical protein n=1 Tax=Aeromicrobium sp. TaxID=1871063 RepID=UPI0030C2F0CD